MAVNGNLGMATPDGRDWRVEWTERLERIDQHLVELNEALLLLLALDDLTRDVLADSPVTGSLESSPPSSSSRPDEWQALRSLLEESRTALDEARQRLQTVADRLVSITAEMSAVSSDLRTLVQKARVTFGSAGQRTNGRTTASASSAPIPPPAPKPIPARGRTRPTPGDFKPSNLPISSAPQEGRTASRRRRWFW